ncbi:hypothetical protein SAMN05216207_105219 [Pseudonocardia ammonioxydans]|uniref:MinD-like ATPase involved in chromosome partitioning or flagellar assembly n=1 Tax=Pseudonocardia ammonioxydans TaxID=260086 RepID=A0A1I5GXC6_PSUAM|nr:hypothetical protein [Pseudonocardia ammonioxydans]SFO40520.1 hypothetical protein SAMN05216207_105219 [Pseudonocardia ammonioxydans]
MTAAPQHYRLAAGPRTPYELNHALGTAARTHAPHLGLLDNEAIVDVTSAAAADGTGERDPAQLAEQLGAATENIQARTATQFPVTRPVQWSAFGALMPVLAGSSGAGASSIAAALTDALQQDERCVLLVDADDPSRSGLACAFTAEGPWTKPVDQRVTVRYSWRDYALVARLETSLPTITPGMVPPPPDWLPDPAPDPLHATVVDLGHGGWRAGASPLYGAGGWLRRGLPAQRPIMVVRATRPALRQAEQLLARLDPWVQRGVATPVFQLVVNGARKWPAGVAGAAGPRVAELLDEALFVPHHPAWSLSGVTDEPSPPRVVDALRPLLASWGLIPSPRRR